MKVFDTNASTHDLFPEWKKCCNAVLNLPSSRDDGDDSEIFSSPLINLLPETSAHQTSDPWYQNAMRLSDSITSMSKILKQEYHVHSESWVIIASRDDDFGILESTVASFAAGTANQIESLRKTSGDKRGDLETHRDGVVSILLERLKRDVVEVMQSIHRERMRIAVEEILKKPLKCRWNDSEMEEEANDDDFDLLENPDGGMIDSTGDIDEEDREFLGVYFGHEEPKMKQNKEPLSQEEVDTSMADDSLKVQSRSLFPEKSFNSKEGNAIQQQHELTTSNNSGEPYDYQENHDDDYLDNIHQEHAAIVTTMTQQTSQLNDIQKMEQTMMHITTLINQFSGLISEQQENIVAIHESAKTTKENLDKGTDQILDATERGKRSGHYMAKFILSLALILWFLNWFYP